MGCICVSNFGVPEVTQIWGHCSAYHGHLLSTIDLSPYKFHGKGGKGKPSYVHIVKALLGRGTVGTGNMALGPLP